MNSLLHRRLNRALLLSGIIFLSLLGLAVQGQTIRYVKQDGSGQKDGTSWTNASGDLQAMINAVGVREVWVAGGLYSTTANNGSFVMKKGVAIYGGFSSTKPESSTADRASLNPITGPPSSSTLTASNGSVINNDGNGLTNSALLDGFVITGGKANVGGGMYNANSGPSLINCLFQGNSATYGGGMHNFYSSISLTNCLFQGNSATTGGGGIFNYTSNPSLTNCLFQGNFAGVGGGMVNDTSSPSLINCLFQGNSAFNGGGMVNDNSGPSLINCRFENNSAENSGGGINNARDSSPRLTNCSFLSNKATFGGAVDNEKATSQLRFTNCSFQSNSVGSNGYGGGINTNAGVLLSNCSFQNNTGGNGGALASSAPSSFTLVNSVVFGNGGGNTFSRQITARYSLFENSVTGYATDPTNLTTTSSPFASASDTQLSACSPAINAGDPTSTSATSGSTDLVGQPRFYGGRIDIGAYEYQASPTLITLTNPTVSTATQGVVFSQSFTATGGQSPYSFSVVSGSLPSGLSLATTGVLSGTPNQSGSYSISVRASDQQGCSGLSGLYSLTVSQPVYLTRYVKQGGSGQKDGTSWTNASGDLQAMINVMGVKEVWVASGTYKPGPAGNTDPLISFAMKEGVAIYGGFPADNSGTMANRNPTGYPTTLSGDLGQPGGRDNSYHVIQNPPSLTNSARLDGFVISGGDASNDSSKWFGGGLCDIDGSPSTYVLANCVFSGNAANTGGAIAIYRSNPTLLNCVFSDNTARIDGGAIYINGGSPIVLNCSFINNRTPIGGAVSNRSGNPTFSNCVFTNNQAGSAGAALYNDGLSQTRLINCTFTANRSSSGAVLANDGDSRTQIQLTNCILWDNQESTNNAIKNENGVKVTASYCLIGQGETDVDLSGPTGNQLIDRSPFASLTDYRLSACSPAINAGDPTSTNATSGTTDLAGQPRFYGGGRIDMGAFEYQGPSDQLAITSQPPSVSNVSPGASVSVAVTISGSSSATAYQWYKDGATVTGQTSATLNLTSAQSTDAGAYSLVATSPCNSVTTTAFRLSVTIIYPTRYVRQNGTGDGGSWATASGDLQSQIDAVGVKEVWVAQGTYKPGPAGNTDRSISFAMKNEVAIYGGFAGNEQKRTDRLLVNPVTGSPSSSTLSGEIGDLTSIDDNTDHVFYQLGSSLNNTAILDGFVITGGNGGSDHTGGGMYILTPGSPTLTNCLFSRNSAGNGNGGGIYNNSNSGLILTNCVFLENTAGRGGGIFNESSNLQLTNCLFQGNSAVLGGGMFNEGDRYPNLINCSFRQNTASQLGGGIANFASSNPIITNCSFRQNTALQQGGAIYNDSSNKPVLTNCSLSQNTADQGGGIFSGHSSKVTLTNCILWNNGGQNALVNTYQSLVTARYCLIEQEETDFTGTNNLVAISSPFVSPTDLRLSGCSVALDAGDPSSTSATSGTTDLAGQPRFYGSRIDIGAYEYQASPTLITLTSPTVSTAIQGVGFSQSFTASGGQSPYSFSVVSGSLPPDLALATTGVLSGTPSQSGSYSISVQATDASGCTSSATSLILSIQSGQLSLRAPSYDCASGAITFNAVGGDGSPIEYFAIGVTPWTSNPHQTTEAELRKDPKKIELLARQNGVTTRYVFDMPAYCAGLPTPPQSSTNPAPVVVQGIGAQTAYQQQSYRFSLPAGTFVDPEGETLRYYVLGLPPDLNFQGTTISGTPTQTGKFVVTMIGVDPLGQTANTSFELRVEPPVPDLTVAVYLQPSVVYGPSEVSLVVDVAENNGVASSGLITVRIPKVTGLNLVFDAGVGQVGGRPVQNGVWSFSDASAGYYELTTGQAVTGGQRLSLSLSGVLSPGATSGQLSVSAMVVGGGENRLTNNADADKLEYFQQ